MKEQVLTPTRAASPLGRSGPCRIVLWSLPAGSAHGAEIRARALVRDSLREAGVAQAAILDAETVVAELAVNAVQHAVSPYELRIIYVAGSLPIWCEIVDGGPITDVIADHLRTPEETGLSEAGRGLQMVHGFSSGRCAAYSTIDSRTGLPAKAVGFALPLQHRDMR